MRCGELSPMTPRDLQSWPPACAGCAGARAVGGDGVVAIVAFASGRRHCPSDCSEAEQAVSLRSPSNMLAAIKRFLARRRQKAAAVDAAVRRLESETGRPAHRGISFVLHIDQLGFVVRVCHGQTKPPRRAWFRVSRDAAEVQKLSFDDVKQYEERLWK
jgi:hypothetical protein